VVEKKAAMKQEIIRRGFLEQKEKKMEISLLGRLNNESNKKNKRRIRVVKERSESKSR
jgi:hypothetical protein